MGTKLSRFVTKNGPVKPGRSRSEAAGLEGGLPRDYFVAAGAVEEVFFLAGRTKPSGPVMLIGRSAS